MEARPIPALYCCYLLRPINKHSPLYVGSTPNPVRRLAQHNGDSKGGAVRTARSNLRPWEMTSIVMGFPSKIAALQFEWAWNNTHITKRIAHDQRISIPKDKDKTNVSPKPGRKRKRRVKPHMSLKDKLSNLHLLLRVPSFARWPLDVRFFCEDVYDKWQSADERVDASIRGGIKVLLDLKKPEEIINDVELPISKKAKGKRKREALGKGGIDGLDVGYSGLKKRLERSIFSLGEDQALKCAVCAKGLDPMTAMALVCPQEDCRTVSHVTCLAARFIEDEGAGTPVVPISGRCPVCRVELQWIDLIKETSLRARGQKEVAEIMKKPKERKSKQAHNLLEGNAADEDEDILGVNMRALDSSDESLPENWHYPDDDDDDMMSIMSGHSALSDGVQAASPTERPSTALKLPAVIEDSDFDFSG